MKQCPKCKQFKSKSQFGLSSKYKDGFRSWCKQCEVDSVMNTRKKNHKKILDRERRTRIYTNSNGKRKTIYGLNKRKFPEDIVCEICKKQAKTLSYHHWDDNNPSLGIWMCYACHCGCNFLEKPKLVKKYKSLKKIISKTAYFDEEKKGDIK